MHISDTMDIDHLRGPHADRMISQTSTRPHLHHSLSPLRAFGMSNALRYRSLALSILLGLALPAQAQVSLSTAVDLALRSNPRVLGAQADVDKARAQLAEAHDAYIPSINAGAGIGQSYGFSSNPPTLFTLTGGSLVYNASQMSYIRSASAGVNAAQFMLEDTRQTVAEDTALAYAALDHDQQREKVIGQQSNFANSLVSIVQTRIDAGQGAPIELTQAKLTAAQLHLASLRAEDDTTVDREHLARLIALPATALTVEGSLPPLPATLLESPSNATSGTRAQGYANPAVASAFAEAEAKQQQARGDSRFRFLPQFNMIAQYNRYATFSDSFAQLQKVYQSNNSQTSLGANQGVFGVQISVPVFDKSRLSKARESSADAAHALHVAQSAQIDALDGQSRLRHSIRELQSQSDVASLQQQLAQQQLTVLQQQLQTGNPNGPQMTPKDEQNARIEEREKFLGLVDASFQLRQAEIHLLRQTGELMTWLKSSALQQSLPASPAQQP
jgi:outer membrane protein TolC